MNDEQWPRSGGNERHSKVSNFWDLLHELHKNPSFFGTHSNCFKCIYEGQYFSRRAAGWMLLEPPGIWYGQLECDQDCHGIVMGGDGRIPSHDDPWWDGDGPAGAL